MGLLLNKKSPLPGLAKEILLFGVSQRKSALKAINLFSRFLKAFRTSHNRNL